MFDLIIIGAGPAGMAAGVYAAKNKLKTLVVAKELFEHTESGLLDFFSFTDLKNAFDGELKNNKKYLQFQKQEVISLEKHIVSFSIEIKTGALDYARSIIIAVGQNPQTKESHTNFDLLTHKNMKGKIKVDANMKTNIPGIFAAGDVTDSSALDFFTAAGQGATAVLGVELYLKKIVI